MKAMVIMKEMDEKGEQFKLMKFQTSESISGLSSLCLIASEVSKKWT